MNRWAAIFEPSSPVAGRAWEAITNIANAVHDGTYPPLSARRPHWQYEDPLLYAYLALAQDDQVWLDRTVESLNSAISHAAKLHRYLELFGGVCGLGWSVAHISQLLLHVPDLESDEAVGQIEQDDVSADVDEFLINRLRAGEWHYAYDLISGLVGLGTYFIERFPSGHSLEAIKLIVGHLQASSKVVDCGIAWHSGPGLLPEWQRELCPEGYYNLGVAHGIPGILQFLGEVAAAGLDDRAIPLLEGGVEWLMAQKHPGGSLSWFTSWVAPGEWRESRLSWCYGDLGILAVMLQIVRHFPRKEWRQFTQALLEHCLAWPMERAGVNDAPLCHGAAGVAHIFNRIYQEEGDVRCRDTALAWFDRTLAMRNTDAGIGGFLSASRPDPEGPTLWEPTPAFLDGAIGIALALLSALTPIEPQWDRLLLLSSKLPQSGAQPLKAFAPERAYSLS